MPLEIDSVLVLFKIIPCRVTYETAVRAWRRDHSGGGRRCHLGHIVLHGVFLAWERGSPRPFFFRGISSQASGLGSPRVCSAEPRPSAERVLRGGHLAPAPPHHTRRPGRRQVGVRPPLPCRLQLCLAIPLRARADQARLLQSDASANLTAPRARRVGR